MKRMIGGDAAAVSGGPGASAGPAPEAARPPLRELTDDRLLDALLERSRDQAGRLRLTGEGPMLGDMIRALLERALEAGLTARLGYEKHERGGAGSARNGTAAKTVQTGAGPVPLQVPRDRAGTFEPVLVPKWSGRVSGGLDDMVISLYARHVEPGRHSPPAAGLRDRAAGRDRLADHRRGAGGGEGVAVPSAGPGLRGGVPGRDRGQGPR